MGLNAESTSLEELGPRHVAAPIGANMFSNEMSICDSSCTKRRTRERRADSCSTDGISLSL